MLDALLQSSFRAVQEIAQYLETLNTSPYVNHLLPEFLSSQFHLQGSVSRDTYYGPQCLEPVSFLRAYENLWELKNKIIDSKMQKENCKITVNV